jgi:hypothetical protein
MWDGQRIQGTQPFIVDPSMTKHHHHHHLQLPQQQKLKVL